MNASQVLTQGSLFESAIEDSLVAYSGEPETPQIVGLTYLSEFINQKQHDELMKAIDAETWLTDLKRRVQHYGFRYDYKSRHVDYTMHIGPLPRWAENVVDILVDQRLVPVRPDQLIVNEYEPGQGIANHVDCEPCFSETIVSLSLGSPCVMNFTNKITRDVVPLLLQPRSLVVMRNEARYNWMHGIAARKSDRYRSITIHRGRRVSLTFRKVLLDNVAE